MWLEVSPSKLPLDSSCWQGFAVVVLPNQEIHPIIVLQDLGSGCFCPCPSCVWRKWGSMFWCFDHAFKHLIWSLMVFCKLNLVIRYIKLGSFVLGTTDVIRHIRSKWRKKCFIFQISLTMLLHWISCSRSWPRVWTLDLVSDGVL